jgi:hypothetical protein
VNISGHYSDWTIWPYCFGRIGGRGRRKNNTRQALQGLEKGLGPTKRTLRNYKSLVLILEEMGRYEEAEASMRRMLAGKELNRLRAVAYQNVVCVAKETPISPLLLALILGPATSPRP